MVYLLWHDKYHMITILSEDVTENGKCRFDTLADTPQYAGWIQT